MMRWHICLAILVVVVVSPRFLLGTTLAQEETDCIIEGTVWHDLNSSGDGEISAVDEPFSGIGIELEVMRDNQFAFFAQTVTDEVGDYRFDHLPQGTYKVQLDMGTLPVVKQNYPSYVAEAAGQDIIITSDNCTVSGINYSYVAYDFGDLPESYDSSHPPASHALVVPKEQLKLGNIITIESNPQYSENARVDDDDDGVGSLYSYHLRPGRTFTVDVIVTGTIPPEGAVLGIWFDWSDDGQFSEDEFYAYNVFEGDNLLLVTAPDSYDACTLGTRFRLFAVGDVPGGTLDWEDFQGQAINGEVEDYMFPSACPSAVTLTTTSSDSPTLTCLVVVFWGVSLTILLLWHKRHNNRKHGSSFPRTTRRTTSMTC